MFRIVIYLDEQEYTQWKCRNFINYKLNIWLGQLDL